MTWFSAYEISYGSVTTSPFPVMKWPFAECAVRSFGPEMLNESGGSWTPANPARRVVSQARDMKQKWWMAL